MVIRGAAKDPWLEADRLAVTGLLELPRLGRLRLGRLPGPGALALLPPRSAPRRWLRVFLVEWHGARTKAGDADEVCDGHAEFLRQAEDLREARVPSPRFHFPQEPLRSPTRGRPLQGKAGQVPRRPYVLAHELQESVGVHPQEFAIFEAFSLAHSCVPLCIDRRGPGELYLLDPWRSYSAGKVGARCVTG